jgi:hypothetical protein
MNSLTVKKLLIIILTVSFAFNVIDAQPSGVAVPGKGKATMNRAPKSSGKARIKKPKSVLSAKKQAAVKEKKLKKDYANYVKANQKRSIEIQTPVVQQRMKQNIKDANSNYRIKKKSNSARTKKAGRKYH